MSSTTKNSLTRLKQNVLCDICNLKDIATQNCHIQVYVFHARSGHFVTAMFLYLSNLRLRMVTPLWLIRRFIYSDLEPHLSLWPNVRNACMPPQYHSMQCPLTGDHHGNTCKGQRTWRRRAHAKAAFAFAMPPHWFVRFNNVANDCRFMMGLGPRWHPSG